MTVPYAFANLSGNIALAKLDSNFNTPITIGNTSVLLGNTVTTLNNLTLANVTITSGTGANISLTSPLAVSSGGTGIANLTVNNVLIGNGTNAITSVAPGATGNVLTSIGGAWVSNVAVTSAAAGANTQVQYNSANLLAGSANLTFDGTNLRLAGGTANGVAYLNGSKVLTTGSALTFDGSVLVSGTGIRANSYMEIRSNTSALYWENAANTLYWSQNLTGSDFTWNYFNGTSVAEQMRLTSTGLGIGTSSPGAPLSFGSVASGARIYLRNNTNEFAIGSDGSKVIFGGFQGFAFNIGSYSGTTAMTLDASGNLGIGVTPSAWGSGIKAIQINSGLSPSVSYYNGFDASLNAYHDGTNWKYILSGYNAGRYTIFGSASGNSSHAWFTAGTGTAGNAISFTQAMTLDASGNLGIGTTSPSASAILDAQSTTKGVRMPNMTTTQKNAIASPAAGLMVFDTTLAKLCVYSGSAWQTITSV